MSVIITVNSKYQKAALCLAILVLVIFLRPTVGNAQDPHLPPTNLGITNMQDGHAPSTGWFYMQYVQVYRARKTFDGDRNEINDAAQMSSMLAMQQIVHINKRKITGGNIGFTVIVPFAKISAYNPNGAIPSINPKAFGDVVAGPLIQWFDSRVFGIPFSHRLEVDLGLPSGAYSKDYVINPGSHAFRVFPHYTFTLSPSRRFSISMRHHLNYYFNEIKTNVKNGITYNFNYSLEYSISNSVFIECAGYYLNQLQEDSKSGNYHYYQDTYNLVSTKENAFAYGGGIGFVSPSGLFIELKGMQEAIVRNRTEGFRTTLVLAYKLNK